MKKKIKPLHFMLRYSDKITKVDTLFEHKKIIEEHGAVWFGKFGAGASMKIISAAKDAIDSKKDCILYLIKGRKYTVKAKIVDIFGSSLIDAGVFCPDVNLVPSYYRKNKCSLWFKITEMESLCDDEVRSLRLYNSPSLPPNLNGMRGLIYVTDDVIPAISPKKISNIYDISLFDS